MPAKVINVEGVGQVKLYKRRGAKSIKLSIAHGGEIRVTLPPWAPYRLGLLFVLEKREWLRNKRPLQNLLAHGQRIGKAHRLFFINDHSTSPKTRVTDTEIHVHLPLKIDSSDDKAQQAARTAGIRALMAEAKKLLPVRLDDLALQHGFEFKSLKIKQLKGRWGSCSQHKDIVLNCFLMQLPWELIDYVIIHELMHTRVLAHGKPFWSEMETILPNISQLRKQMRAQQPALNPEV